jgi:hypothetical protein
MLNTILNLIRSTVFLSIAICLIAAPLFAQIDTVEATYKYVMGDNDTKTDARNLCFLNAKKLCMEKTGTFVQSQLSIKRSEVIGGGKSDYDDVTEQDIQTYAGAFLKVEVVNEELSYAGETIAISMTVRAVVDARNILDQITAVKEDQSLAKRIREQHDKLADLEIKIREIQKKLKSTNPDLTKAARVERVEVFANMSMLESIKYDIAFKTKMAVDYVELGMTCDEVKRLIGEPRSSHWDYSYNYGQVWVIFEHGIVTCVVNSVNRKYDTRAQYESWAPELILK